MDSSCIPTPGALGTNAAIMFALKSDWIHSELTALPGSDERRRVSSRQCGHTFRPKITLWIVPHGGVLDKTGSAEYDTYYVDNPVAKIDSGVGTGTIVDETGITRNVKGEGPFNDMSVRCLYHWSVVGETNHFNGSCVETDKDGDNVFTTFDDKNHYLMGGTGKYKGITGTVPYTIVELHDTVGGRPALIVNHKATWEIK
jgi:hypothetical protein